MNLKYLKLIVLFFVLIIQTFSFNFLVYAEQSDNCFMRKFCDLSDEQQKLVMQKMHRFKKMPLRERKEILKNFKNFRALKDEEKNNFRKKYRYWKHLSSEEKEIILNRQKKWQRLPLKKRRALRKKFMKRRMKYHKKMVNQCMQNNEIDEE